MVSRDDLPKYKDFEYPVLVAAATLGGSGHKSEIISEVISAENISDEALDLIYEGPRDKSLVVDRIEWAMSYNVMGGVMDRPERGLYVLNASGRRLLGMDEEEARSELLEMDRQVRRERRADRKAAQSESSDDEEELEDTNPLADEEWRSEFLGRLHQLTPEEFEEFCLEVLRAYGLRLERVGGSGDEGIDGIGSAPLSDVLSTTVAVQCKRYDPSRANISRDTVALFQRDAAAKGAERAVMITLGGFTRPAQKAATVTTPTVDLIDGDRLCDLALAKQIGVRELPAVDEGWFTKRFG